MGEVHHFGTVSSPLHGAMEEYSHCEERSDVAIRNPLRVARRGRNQQRNLTPKHPNIFPPRGIAAAVGG